MDGVVGPLTGRTIAVTRAAEQAGPLVARLVALGASVREVPLIEIVDPLDGGAALRAAASSLDAYDWVVVTSPNGARRLLDAIAAVGAVADQPSWPSWQRLGGSNVPAIAVVGPGTAQVFLEQGVAVDLIPRRAIGEGLVEAFPVGPGRVLFPRAEVARSVVEDGQIGRAHV